jgi:uncharacterized NAD-dependent epimerase/dehydratase family protein
MLRREQKLAIYMEGAVLGFGGKMGFGVLRYSPNPIVCVIDSETAGRDIKEAAGMPNACPIVATVEQALALGAEVLVLGIAPPGGLIPPAWYPVIDQAVQSGFSIINGLHDLVGPRYSDLRDGQWIWDIRVEPEGLMPGTGAAASLTNRRVLLIGTDMSIGKMTAGLEIYRVARERGINAEFVATGQIGITITGSGVPLDAVRVDFSAGAIEREVMNRKDAELVLIEGQGSLGHPGSTANLPLLRGSMPTHLVLCHRVGQDSLKMLPHVPLAPLGDFIRLYEDVASCCGIFPRPTTIGVALNTGHLASDEEALEACARIERELGLPCVDPVRHGPGRLIDSLMTGA